MSCYECGGQGWVVTCCDDMCRGVGECMHGDGESLCPVCYGDEDFGESDDEADYPHDDEAAE